VVSQKYGAVIESFEWLRVWRDKELNSPSKGCGFESHRWALAR